MKRIFVLTLLISASTLTYSQSETHKTLDRSGENGTVLYFFQRSEIQGTQFLKDSWTNAKVVTNSGYTFDNVALKFDVYNNKFVFNRNDSMLELTDATTAIYLDDKEAGKKIFKKGYEINGRVNKNKYVQVLAEGKATLLKFYVKDIEEYNEYGNATKLQRYHEMQQYYIQENGQYTSVALNKKNLETALQSKWAPVDAYLKQNNLSGKDEKSWSAAVTYYNSL